MNISYSCPTNNKLFDIFIPRNPINPHLPGQVDAKNFAFREHILPFQLELSLHRDLPSVCFCLADELIPPGYNAAKVSRNGRETAIEVLKNINRKEDANCVDPAHSKRQKECAYGFVYPLDARPYQTKPLLSSVGLYSFDNSVPS